MNEPQRIRPDSQKTENKLKVMLIYGVLVLVGVAFLSVLARSFPQGQKWLAPMACDGILDYTSAIKGFSISPTHRGRITLKHDFFCIDPMTGVKEDVSLLVRRHAFITLFTMTCIVFFVLKMFGGFSRNKKPENNMLPFGQRLLRAGMLSMCIALANNTVGILYPNMMASAVPFACLDETERIVIKPGPIGYGPPKAKGVPEFYCANAETEGRREITTYVYKMSFINVAAVSFLFCLFSMYVNRWFESLATVSDDSKEP